MLLFSYFFAALIGLLLGSFYTASAYRVLYFFYGPERKNHHRWRLFFTKRSFCMECGQQLPVSDLIPIVSYFMRQGRCRFCQAPIGRITLLGELFMGLLLPGLLLAGYSWPAAFFTALLAGQLYIAIATDGYFFQLDHENTLLIFFWALLATLFKNNFDWLALEHHLYSMLITFGIFLLLYYISQGRSLGFGDVLLAGAISVFTGYPWTIVAIQGGAVGSLVYIFLIKKDKRAPAPFGLFLALGVYLAIVAEAIWYF